MSDKAKKKLPVYKQRMLMHLNGGSDYSQMTYEITKNGKDTGIIRLTRTNGSPQYVKTVDELVSDSDRFDILASKGKDAGKWLDDQTKRKKKEKI